MNQYNHTPTNNATLAVQQEPVIDVLIQSLIQKVYQLRNENSHLYMLVSKIDPVSQPGYDNSPEKGPEVSSIVNTLTELNSLLGRGVSDLAQVNEHLRKLV